MVKSFDYLGPEITFRVNNQENFKTVFGGIISIFSYSLFFYFFFIFGTDFFYKQNPKVLTQFITPLNDKNSTFTLNKDFHLAFRLVDEGNKIIELNSDNNSIQLFNQVYLNGYTENYNNPLSLKKCSEKDFPYLVDGNANDYFCCDFANNNITLGGGWETINSYFSNIVLSITINQSLFLSYSKINNSNKTDYSVFIKKPMYLEIIIPRVVFDAGDYLSPLKLQPEYIWTYLTKYSGVDDQIHLSDYRVETDDGILTENIKLNQFTGYNKRINFNYFANDTNIDAQYFLQIYYDYSYNLSTRQYMKFQDLLGNISGFMDIIYFVLSLLISLNSNYRLNKLIVNKLTYITESNEIKNLNPKLFNLNVIKDLNEPFDDERKKVHHIKSPQEKNNCVKDCKFHTNNECRFHEIHGHLRNSHLYSNKNLFNSGLSDRSNFNKSNLGFNIKEELNENIQNKIEFLYRIAEKKEKRFLEYNFFDYLINGKIFGTRHNYDSNITNKSIADSIYDQIIQKFDIIYYLKSQNRLNLTEALFFDDKQKILFRYLAEKEFYYKYNKTENKLKFIDLNSKDIDKILIENYYNNLFKNNNYSIIDEKIFNIVQKCFE